MGIGTSYKVEAFRQKSTNEPLREALDSNEASDVTSDVISAKQYKPRYKLGLEVLHFRDTSFEVSVSFVTSLDRRFDRYFINPEGNVGFALTYIAHHRLGAFHHYNNVSCTSAIIQAAVPLFNRYNLRVG